MLGDENKRKQYDMFGAAGSNASAGSGGPGMGFGGSGFQYQSQVDPEELFRTIFGDAFRQGRDFENGFDDDRSQSFDVAQVTIIISNAFFFCNRVETAIKFLNSI